MRKSLSSTFCGIFKWRFQLLTCVKILAQNHLAKSHSLPLCNYVMCLAPRLSILSACCNLTISKERGLCVCVYFMTSEARGAAQSRSRGWLSRLWKQSVAVSRPGWLDYCAALLARVNRNKCGDWTVSSVASYSTRQRGEDKKYIHNNCVACSLKVLVIRLEARKLVVSRPPLFTKAKTNL